MQTIKTKPELINEITQAIADGVISSEDLEQFIIVPSKQYVEAKKTEQASTVAAANDAHHLSAVEILFYIAGLILFAAIVSVIVQSWEPGNVAGHVLLSGGVGVLLWIVAAVLGRQQQTPILEGLKNSLLLTGSLSLILAAFIVTNELLGSYSELDFLPFAVTLLVVSAIHFAFDRVVKSGITLLVGIFLAVAAFPLLFFNMLRDINASVDAWSFVVLLATVLLAVAPRVVARMYPERPGIAQAFDSVAAFIGLSAMYIASFGNNGVLWLFLLIIGVIGLFYASIVRQEKPLLGSASVFLVIAIITISFRYFSEFGVTVSLIIAAGGLLGTAAIATTISKKYFPSQN